MGGGGQVRTKNTPPKNVRVIDSINRKKGNLASDGLEAPFDKH